VGFGSGNEGFGGVNRIFSELGIILIHFIAIFVLLNRKLSELGIILIHISGYRWYAIVSGINPLTDTMELIQAIKKYEGQPITRQIFLDLLKGYKRPLDKLGELVREGYLLQAKRGIYIPGPELKMAGPEPFLLANYLVGPSYVSLDTALSYWGLIPERVYEISSVTTARPRTIRTAAGRFSYQRLHLPYYSFGIKQVALTTRQTALVASPEKALCDKLITTSALTLRSAKQTMELLVDDFRIEKQALRDLNLHEINRWIPDATKKDSLLMLVKTLEKL
jgi:hypothetical protein